MDEEARNLIARYLRLSAKAETQISEQIDQRNFVAAAGRAYTASKYLYALSKLLLSLVKDDDR